MENLSNNKLHSSLRGGGMTTKQSINNNRNSLRLFLLLFHFSLFIVHYSIAQNAYNKLYTLQAHASMFQAVAPHGSLGGCMAAATVVDSSTGIQAIRIARFDALGNLQASNYFNIPDDTARTIYVNYKAMTRVHDNCYTMVGKVLHYGVQEYSFVLLADSNGIVYRYKDIISRDTVFNYMSAVQYDGYGHIIIAGHFSNKSPGPDSTYGVVYKFDTALNLIWQKQYHPSGILLYPLLFNLIVDNSGYTLGGGGTNGHFNSDKPYKTQSLIIKTDTAGVLQWSLASPAVFYTDYQSFIGAIVHTKDGGYLFATEGHTYNSYPSSAPVIQLAAKKLIIKLDAARNKQWEIVVDDYFGVIGYVPRTHLIELEDSSFLFLGGRTTDSLDPNLKTGKLVLQHYSSNGALLKQRIINKYAPRSIDDTHKESGGPIYDIKQTADKSFVLCGYYENKTVGAPAPAQRAWLLKLDSNLCLGVGDSQCIPTSVIEFPKYTEAVFRVYPNPTQQSIHLSVAASQLIIYNTLGQIVLKANAVTAEQAIEVAQLNTGLYFVEVYNKEKNKIGVGKFYKE